MLLTATAPMSESSIAVQTYTDIQNDFNLDPDSALSGLDDSKLYDLLHQYLASRILELMNKNLEQLMNVLYRIDLNELSVKEIFRLTDEQIIAEKLATLVIARQKMKAETREAFRNSTDLKLED
jgi:hypothetical protein